MKLLWNTRLTERVRAPEARARRQRTEQGKTVIGRDRLLKQPITFNFQSKRSGKRMWCLSEKRSVRMEFIEFFKRILREARDVYRRWHVGDYSVPCPPGLFPPAQPKLYELITAW